MSEKYKIIIPEEVYAALKEYGLTDYETRAFIALITNGTSSAKELSNFTHIPYSRIYDVLVNLENIGWVAVISGRPMKYRAERPKHVARIAKKQIEAKFERIEFALVDKLEPLYGHQKQVDSTPIWILNGEIHEKIKDMFQAITKEVLICYKHPDEQFLEKYFDILLHLSENQAKINLVIDKRYLNIGNKNIWRKLSSIASIQLVERVQFDTIFFDDKEMLLFLTSFFKLVIEDENMLFLIQEKRLINHAKDYIKKLTQNGEKFSLKDYN
jgi:sugar-specific transcriptional regulator TrmB